MNNNDPRKTTEPNNTKEGESVQSRISKMKTLYEKKTGKQTHLEKIIEDVKTTTASLGISSRASIYNNKLAELEENRKNANFSNLAEEFGFNTLINKEATITTTPAPEIKETHEEQDAYLNRVRSSIVYKTDSDFQSKLKKFRAVGEKSEDKISQFVNQTNSMCQNYEKEIQYLRDKISILEKESQKFSDLEIDCFRGVELLADSKKAFVDRMSSFKDPSVVEITTIYNEKIMELFAENESVTNELQKFKQDAIEKEKLELKIQELKKIIQNKDDQIKQISQVYHDKFTEVFGELDKSSCEIEILKKQLEEKEAEEQTIREIANTSANTISGQNDLIQSLKKEIVDWKKLYEDEKKNSEWSASKDQVDLELLKEKQVEMEKLSLGMEQEIKTLLSEKKSMEEKIEGEEIEKRELKKTIVNLGKQCGHFEELKNEREEKLLEMENQQKDLKESYGKLENKKRFLEEENNQMREIITKDQVRINKLMEKIAAGGSPSADLKQENEKFKEKLSEVENEIKYQLNEQERMKAEKEQMIIQLEKQRKIIEDLTSTLASATTASESSTMISQSTSEISLQIPTSASSSSQAKLLNETFSLTRELIMDYIFCLYLYENSINISQIAEIVLFNFNLYMGTSFLRKEDYNLTFSLMNEFLESVFFRIYDKCISKKLSQSTSSSSSTTETWAVNPDDITPEIINELCSEINDNNIISSIASINRQVKPIETIIDLVIQKYEPIFPKLIDFITNEVKPVLGKKLEKYKRGLLNDLRTVIEYATKNIKNGRIYSNGKEVYNLKNYFTQIASRDISKPGEFYIYNTFIHPEALDNLITYIKYHCNTIRHVYLSGAIDGNPEMNIAKLMMGVMVYCPMLEGFSINGCNMNGYLLKNVIKLIENHKNLQILDMSDSNLGDEGIRQLVEAIKLSKTITALFLNKNFISTNGGFYLADALIKNKILQKLHLGGNTINENGMSSMLTVLAHNNFSLKELNISSNSLITEDFQYISDFLQMNPPLLALDISSNQIDPVSANYLGTGLIHTKQLKYLNVSNANLNEESAPLLLKHLGECMLEEIVLDNNPLGEVGTIVFASILKYNTHLKFASFKNCKITSIALSCLGKSLNQNAVFEELNLENNVFEEQGLLLFSGIMRDKKVRAIMTDQTIPSKVRDAVLLVKNIVLK